MAVGAYNRAPWKQNRSTRSPRRSPGCRHNRPSCGGIFDFDGKKQTFTAIINGDKAWESDGGKAQDITGEKLEYTKNEVYQMWVTSLTPLEYDHYYAAAPGIVLVKAPGHTPGSQLVFVKLASGKELLFIGDVAWHMDQIRQLWYRPRLVTDFYIH